MGADQAQNGTVDTIFTVFFFIQLRGEEFVR